MSSNRYSLSFTTGSLFHNESIKLAALYQDVQNWQTCRDRVIAENLLQTRTQNTLRRVCRELISRLKTLNSDELQWLLTATHQQQGYLLWLAICRRYSFIADFAVEVLRERYITLKPDLNHQDFDAYFDQKSEWHKELKAITSTTRCKLRQVLFKMLREAELLSTNHTIKPAMLSPQLSKALSDSQPRNLLYFPIFHTHIKELTR